MININVIIQMLMQWLKYPGILSCVLGHFGHFVKKLDQAKGEPKVPNYNIKVLI